MPTLAVLPAAQADATLAVATPARSPFHGCFTIPAEDAWLFTKLEEPERCRIIKWLRAFERLPARGKRPLFRQLAVSLASTEGEVRDTFYAVRKAGWRAMAKGLNADGSDVAERGLSEEAVEAWKKFLEDQGGVVLAAHKRLQVLWLAKDRSFPIPGFEDWPGWPRMPRGLSDRNLARYKTSRVETAALTLGLSAARAAHGPLVYTTRVGMHFGAAISFDDHELNFNGRLGLSGDVFRPVGLFSMEFLSGKLYEFGARPRLVRKDGTKSGLRAADARLHIAATFYRHGYSPRGTVGFVEHGHGAGVSADVEEILHRHTGGLLTFRRSGIDELRQRLGLPGGRGRGNPMFKAPLESSFNGLDNALMDIEGQTGRSVPERPEFLHGHFREAEVLSEAAAKLEAERAALLELPFLDWHSQLLPLLHQRIAEFNGRRTHELEGWGELGWIITEYLHAARGWLDEKAFLALPAAERAMLAAAAQAEPKRFTQRRRLSPSEVWDAHRAELVPLPEAAVAELLFGDWRTARRVADSYFEFEDQELWPDPLRYVARIRTPQGTQEELRDRETYEVVVNPFDLETLWVYGARGNFLGTAARDRAVRRTDYDAAMQKYGEGVARLNEQLEKQGIRQIGRVKKRAKAMHAAADALDTSRPLTVAERRTAARRAERALPVSVAAPAPAPAPVRPVLRPAAAAKPHAPARPMPARTAAVAPARPAFPSPIPATAKPTPRVLSPSAFLRRPQS